MAEQNPELDPARTNVSPNACEVVVVGAGLAGRAASIGLARAGLRVICISPGEGTRPPVGESLDWSAPDLLKTLGLPMDQLVATQMATWKRHVTLRMPDGSSEHYTPSPWLGNPPLNIELRTLHLDRIRFDNYLLNLTSEAGVVLIRDKVVGVERDGNRIRSVRTAGGASYVGNWFIDASGMGASVLAREFDLPMIEDGPAKVALWAYFPVSDPPEGTTLYMDPSPSHYLDWVWEIPVNPESVSVGFVTTGSSMKTKRDQGLSVNEIYQQELAKYPRFEALLQAGAMSEVSVTSFKARVYRDVAGPNWLICGEAASMVDPITANGVTAALRHAAEASSLILKYRTKGKLSRRARICYSSRIVQMAKFFNGGIEKIVYNPPVRNRIGLPTAGTVYTGPAWSMNAVYARLKPSGILSTLLLCAVLGTFRLGASVFYRFSRNRDRATISSGGSPLAA